MLRLPKFPARAFWPTLVLVLFELLQLVAFHLDGVTIDLEAGSFNFREAPSLEWAARDQLFILGWLVALYISTLQGEVRKRFVHIFLGCTIVEQMEFMFYSGGHGALNIYVNVTLITITILYAWTKLK